MTKKPLTYKDAGVDVERGEEVVRNMGELLRSTWVGHPVLRDVAGFQAVYDLGDELLVAGTDGVGTKLLVGITAGKVDTVGQDLVAMCVNDLARAGVNPLFFLDYMATAKLTPEQHYQVLEGIVEGCKQAGIPLLGGETAEMPSMYQRGHFDLAGFAVGMVKKENLLDGSQVKEGARLLGIASSGLHSNGYSLARRVFEAYLNEERIHEIVPQLMQTTAEVLLEPTMIYTRPVLSVLKEFPSQVQGGAHITGGGKPNKLPKTLPEGLGAEIHEGSWHVHPIFDYIQEQGPVELDEMRKTFNRGIGMVLVVNDSGAVTDMQALLQERHGLKAYDIGKVVQGKGVVYR